MKTLDCIICQSPFIRKTSDKTCSVACRKQLANNRARQYHQDNIDSCREYKRKQSYRHRRENPEQRLLAGARQRAKIKNLPIDIAIEDIVIPELCPILKVPMKIGSMYAPSLDRKIPELGYTKDNIWVISRKANVMKNDATKEELERFRDWLISQL